MEPTTPDNPTGMRTYIIRRDGITGIFYGPNLISAWDGAGNLVNLWYAYLILKDPAGLS